MIFKFDKSGNMENIGVEGDIDMARKVNKDRFNQMDMNVVNQVKEEVLNGMSETQSQVAAGFESLDEIIGDDDMVQQHETELVKEMDAEDDDEKLKQQMRELNMRNMPSLSNLTKMKDENEGNGGEEDSSGEGVGNDKEQMSVGEFNETKNELEVKRIEKEEKEKKKLARDLKKELKQMDLKLKESTNWSFSPVIPIYRQGVIRKYSCVISAYELASYFENSVIRFVHNIQRGKIITPSGKERDNFSAKHVADIFRAYTENTIEGNTIVLNYSTDNESDLIYDHNKHSISGEGYLQGVDFSHRARAAIKWKNAWVKHPEQYDDPRQFQFPCEVNNISDNEAMQMFSEYNNFSLKVNPTRTSYLDNTNYANKIARRIEKESDWKNKIETVSTQIKSSSFNICSYGVLTNAIKKNYKEPQTKLEQKSIEDWLIEYVDELVSLFPQFMANSDLESKNNLKKLYFTIEPLAIGAMIALSAVLKDDPDWKTKLAKLANDDFFLRTDPRWRPALKEGGKIINGTSSVKHFNETVINWCTK